MARITYLSFSFILAFAMACEEEKPSTPFQVATSLPRQQTAAPPAPEPDSPAAQARVVEQAPRSATTWKVFDKNLRAPEGTHLRAATRLSAQAPDRLLVLLTPRPDAGDASAAGLWKTDEAGKLSDHLIPHPAFLPSGKDCPLQAQLEVTGPASVVMRLRARCSSRLLPGTPTQFLAVVAPDKTEPGLVELRATDPAPGEELRLEVQSADSDQDGLDDVQLNVTLKAPDGTEETLPFYWLSRTAGASRQSDEPRETLAKRASRIAISAVRKAERDGVRHQVRALRRLLSSVCGELGAPRLTRTNGDALSCGPIDSTLFRLTHAAVQAELGRGDLGTALGWAERASWFGAKPTDKQEKSLHDLILGKLPHRPAKQLARFDVKAAASSTAYASPLHFGPSGQLWLLPPDREVKRLTMRGDPPLSPADGEGPRVEAPSWTMEPEGPGARRLSAALPSCQRSEVQLAFSRSKGPPPAPVPIAMLAPRPGNCRTFTGVELEAQPIAWSGGHLQVILGGELIVSGGRSRPPSEPVAWPTRFGLASAEGAALELWTEIPTNGLHHCVASKGREKVACLKGSSVYVYGPDEAEKPETKGQAE